MDCANLLPKEPQRVTAGRYTEPLWEYNGNVGTFFEVGMLYELDCKKFAIEALKQVSTSENFEKALANAVSALNQLNNTQEPPIPYYATEGKLSIVEQKRLDAKSSLI